jgi:putative hemolysin
VLRDLLVIAALLVLNGVFSGAEIAVLSVRKTRLNELLERKARGALAIRWLRHQPERFLATVQIGITVVGTTAAAFGGEQIAGDFGRWLAARAPWLGPHAAEIGLAGVIVLLSYSQIVMGELVPKSLALRGAERYALAVGPALRTMASLVRPVVWLLTQSSNVVLRLFGDKTSFTEARLSPEELQELVEEAARVGAIDAKASEIASRAIDFRELTAADVMVPRVRIRSVDRDASREELRKAMSGRRVARLLVHEGSPENIVGYVALKDLAATALEGVFEVAAVMRPARFVPSTLEATTLLRDMQTQRIPLVVVVDEEGGLLGLVTLEDLLEELVGDILSEDDPALEQITRGEDGSVVVLGQTPLRDINRALGLELPDPKGVVTIAGLCLSLAHAIPEVGAEFTLPDGTRLQILDAGRRHVRRVRLWPAKIEDKAQVAL